MANTTISELKYAANRRDGRLDLAEEKVNNLGGIDIREYPKAERDRGKSAKNSSELWDNFRQGSVKVGGRERDRKIFETFLNLKKTTSLVPRSSLIPQHKRQEQNYKAHHHEIAPHW